MSWEALWLACACRKLDPDIMVVQSAEDRQGYNSSGRMDDSGYRSVLDKGQMRSSDVVVFRIRAEHMAQMSLPEDEDVIKALPADRADQPFDMAVLPRRSRRCRSVANAHGANAPSERLAIDPIAITDKILRRVPASPQSLASRSIRPWDAQLPRARACDVVHDGGSLTRTEA